MTKKQQKAHRQKTQTLKELVLVTVSFQYLWENIAKLDEEDKKTRDYKLTAHICNQLAYRIKTYKPLHSEVIDLWQTTDIKDDNNEHNPFLAGLALLGVHMEASSKRINVGLDKEIIELQDLAYEFFKADDINKVADWAEGIKEALELV